MVKPGGSFADSMALIAARIEELGKRPVSEKTHSEIAQLRDQLDIIVKNFVLCPSCGGMFPSNTMAQMTLNRKSATLCTACAITALQTGKIGSARSSDMTIEQDDVVTPSTNDNQDDDTEDIDGPGTRTAVEKPTDEPDEHDDAYAKEDDGSGKEKLPPSKPAPKPVPQRASSTARGVTRRTKRASVEAAEEEERESAPITPPAQEITPAPNYTPAIPSESDKEPEDEEDDTPRSTPKRMRRIAKRPVGDGQLKATVAEVSKHTGRNTREVRNIAKLIEEISPPLNVDKTTRYVLSELKNSRSRIPVDVVPGIIAALKNGLPSKNNGNGDASGK
jgi:hypothetical protein